MTTLNSNAACIRIRIKDGPLTKENPDIIYYMVREYLEIRSGRAGAGLFVGCGAGIGYLSPVNIYAVPVVGQMVGSILQNISRADQGLGGIGHRVTSLLGSVQFPGGVRAGVGCGVGIGYGWGIGVMLKPSASSRIVDTVRSLLPAQALHVSSDPHDSSAPEIAATTKENRTDVVLREEFETLKHRVEDLEREMTLLRHDSKHTR